MKVKENIGGKNIPQKSGMEKLRKRDGGRINQHKKYMKKLYGNYDHVYK